MKKQNKLRLSRLLMFAAMAVIPSLLLSSCEWFKPARDSKKDKVYKQEDIDEIQGKKVFDPVTGTWRVVYEVNEKVDTVRWTELSPERFPPITSDGSWTGTGIAPGNTGTTTSPAGNHTYNVVMMLPFIAQRADFTTIDENSLWAVHYYAGAKLAYDDLKRDGAMLNISVLDSEGTTGKVTTLLRSSDLQKADLIIGPYRRDNVKLVSDFSKTNKIPQVVPYTAQMGMTENNPWYIQVNPSLKSHCEAITRHARKKYRTEEIVLVARDKTEEQTFLKYFQDANAVIEGRTISAQFKEYLVKDETGDFHRMDVSPYVRSGKTTVFIVPSWSNEGFVYSLLRQLMVKRSEGEDIVVYGMPQWMGFEQIDYDFFEKLKLHVSSPFYVDPADEKIKQFKRKFFDTYGAVPQEEAYIGYDIMRYSGLMLKEWGKDFPSRIDRTPFDVLHGRFEFNRIVINPEQHKENLNYYDQLENTYVRILKFQDFRFQVAN
jgi:hypothetical protein